MNEFQTGAVRDTGGKGRMDLLPWCSLLRVSKHMENSILPDPDTGKPHYPERNWEKGMPIHSMVDSAFRHLAKYADGWTDEDHLCAAATNLLMAMWMEEKMPEMQDIPSRCTETAKKDTLDVQGLFRSTERPNDKEEAKEDYFVGCSCYDGEYERCKGTKEVDPCTCGGNKSKCDFYPEKGSTRDFQTVGELID